MLRGGRAEAEDWVSAGLIDGETAFEWAELIWAWTWRGDGDGYAWRSACLAWRTLRQTDIAGSNKVELAYVTNLLVEEK